jgi:predicted nucleic acid-binding protein
VKFADRNVILYSLLADQAPVKHAIAIALLKSDDLILSTQVIGEVSAVLSRKTSLSNQDIRRIAEDLLLRFPVFSVEKEDLLEALSIREEYNMPYWDSLIVAVALRAGANIIYSEDSHDGLVIRGRLTIRNPFKGV